MSTRSGQTDLLRRNTSLMRRRSKLRSTARRNDFCSRREFYKTRLTCTHTVSHLGSDDADAGARRLRVLQVARKLSSHKLRGRDARENDLACSRLGHTFK